MSQQVVVAAVHQPRQVQAPVEVVRVHLRQPQGVQQVVVEQPTPTVQVVAAGAEGL